MPLSPTDAVQRRVWGELAPFLLWGQIHRAKLSLGEFGCPANHHAADADEWKAVLALYYEKLQQARVHSYQWVAGQAYATNENAVYTGAGVGSALTTAEPQSVSLEAHRNDTAVRRGLAVSGLETIGAVPGTFSNVNLGTVGSHFFEEPAASFTYLASRGIKHVRIPFRIERTWPSMAGALDTTHLNMIKTQVARAKAAGMTVVLDAHNFGGYCTAAGEQKVGTAGFPASKLRDFWVKMALEFNSESAIVGYEIMNEPCGAIPLGAAGWQVFSNSTVAGIRFTGSTKECQVGGYEWSKVQPWLENHPRPWINDLNVRYIGHHYWDIGADSVYGTYAACEADAIAEGY